MKTILHFTPLAVIGGCEVNCLRLIKGMRGCHHRVVVFDDIGPMTAEWEEAGAEVIALNAWTSGAAQFEAALVRWMEAQGNEPDGIIYWSTSRFSVFLRALRCWRAPLVVHLGNPLPEGSITGAARRWWMDRSCRPRQDTFLAACSEQVADSYRGAGLFRQYPVKVIYNPVEQQPDFKRAHRALHVGSDALIGMVGRLDRIKDQITIIRAAAKLRVVWPGLQVEFAGDGDQRRQLEEEAARLGVSDRIRFLGFVQVRSRLAAWDVYIHSTTRAEGMGTALAEAMMEGLPCVVSDLPVMREVCGTTAEYFPSGDAAGLARVLHLFLGNRARRELFAGAARTRACGMFSMEGAALAYGGLLESAEKLEVAK